MVVAYADPPYIGCADKYHDHPDYAGEVDHAQLVKSLAGYDGWILHSHVPGLVELLPMMTPDVRVCAWVKPFAAFKPNVPVAYAWEPVFVKACRKPVVSGRSIMRDWFACNITMRRGLCGVKPEALCQWLFEVAGMETEDRKSVV